MMTVNNDSFNMKGTPPSPSRISRMLKEHQNHKRRPNSEQNLEVGLETHCRGHSITIETMNEQECPEYAFTLSIKQSFRTENFIFKSTVTDIQVRQTPSTSVSQQEVNSQLLPGVNPYLVENNDFELSLNGVSTSFKNILYRYSHVISVGIFITVVITVAVVLSFRCKKTNSNTAVIRQVP